MPAQICNWTSVCIDYRLWSVTVLATFNVHDVENRPVPVAQIPLPAAPGALAVQPDPDSDKTNDRIGQIQDNYRWRSQAQTRTSNLWCTESGIAFDADYAMKQAKGF